MNIQHVLKLQHDTTIVTNTISYNEVGEFRAFAFAPIGDNFYGKSFVESFDRNSKCGDILWKDRCMV